MIEHRPKDIEVLSQAVARVARERIHDVSDSTANVVDRESGELWETQAAANAGSIGEALWGSSATDIYLATAFVNAPTVYHSTGGTWRGQAMSPTRTVYDILGTGPDHIFAAVENMGVFFSTGDGAWTRQLVVEGLSVFAIWAASRDAVYACSAAGMFYRSNGAGTWSAPQAIDPALDETCFAIWGTSPDNIYVCTEIAIYHGTP